MVTESNLEDTSLSSASGTLSSPITYPTSAVSAMVETSVASSSTSILHSQGTAVTDVVNIGVGVTLDLTPIEDESGLSPQAQAVPTAEVVSSTPLVSVNNTALAFWYLTGDGQLMCIPYVDSQFLNFGTNIIIFTSRYRHTFAYY